MIALCNVLMKFSGKDGRNSQIFNLAIMIQRNILCIGIAELKICELQPSLHGNFIKALFKANKNLLRYCETGE